MGLGRFGAIAGAVAGLAVGLGISIVHSRFSESVAASAPTPVLSVTSLLLPDSAAKPLGSASLAEQLAEQVKVHRESIARHEREPRDSIWATQTEQVLLELLATLANPRTFRVTSIDCRTTTCVAYLSAASYEEARQAWPSIINARSDTKCGTEVTLDAPPPNASAFDFSVVYDCERARQPDAHRE
jgi:hypothetical protein